MHLSLSFIRIFFVVLSAFFMTAYKVAGPEGLTAANILIGLGLGLGIGLCLVTLDTLFKKFNLRAFNLAILGLFVGFLMGQVLGLILDHILAFSASTLPPEAIGMGKTILFLLGCYLGSVMTLRSSDEICMSIPFVKLTPVTQKRKDLLADISLFSDPRIIDLCATGVLDHQLVIPRFLIKELYSQVEVGDEISKAKARKALEVIKKLETHGTLDLRYHDTDFPEIKDLPGKLIRLARLLECNILTADFSRVQMTTLEGVRLINLHTLSNALKPLMQTAEQLKIKIQRVGKEPRQGIGYLDDGTMVVVNGGGTYIGEMIDAQVLSVKHTTSGRMIFCNAHDEESRDYEDDYNGR